MGFLLWTSEEMKISGFLSSGFREPGSRVRETDCFHEDTLLRGDFACASRFNHYGRGLRCGSPDEKVQATLCM